MKTCAYCGRENDDAAVTCADCGTDEFKGVAVAQTGLSASAAPTDEARTSELALAPAPSVRWTPKRAWFSVLVVLALYVVVCIVWVTFVTMGFSSLVKPPPLVWIFANVIPLVVSIVFSGVTSLAEFRQKFAVVPASKAALVVAFACGFLLQAGTSCVLAGGFQRWMLRTSIDWWVVGAPFVEEPWMSGYLYPSFRTRYSIIGSVVCVSLISVFLHCPYWLDSTYAFVSIAFSTVATCLLRERTKSLWPPIVCHLAYNAIPAASGWSGQ